MEPILGEIKIFAGNFAPVGWYLCQGQTLNISQNAALYSLLGTFYGGDGVSNFKLPDLRGIVPVQASPGGAFSGLNLQLGQIAGTASTTLTSAQMPMHTHTVAAVSGAANQLSASGMSLAQSAVFSDGSEVNTYSDANADVTLKPTTIGVAGGSQPVSLVQPTMGMNYIIAYQGVYPQRP